MLKNDTLKNGTSRIGLYGSAPPPREIEAMEVVLWILERVNFFFDSPGIPVTR